MAPELHQDPLGRDPALQDHGMLAVGGEDVVVLALGQRRADLGRLLAAQRGPQGHLALALQRGGHLVQAARPHHRAVHPLQRLGIDVLDPAREALVVLAGAVLVEQADHGHGRGHGRGVRSDAGARTGVMGIRDERFRRSVRGHVGGDLDGRRGLRRLRGRLLSAGLLLIGSPLRDLVGLRHGTPPGVVHAVARPRAGRPGSSCLRLRLLRAEPGDEAVS